jgi:hypothetical protein
VRRTYHTIEKNGKANARKLAALVCKNGQFLIPLVELIEQCRLACDELIEVTGQSVLQAILQLSPEQVAWPAARRGDAERFVP